MRVCILTQYFPPEMGAPQGRLSELGERLIDRGWQVDALTALPNYPTGKVFDGYDPRRSKVEMVGRIHTARVPLWPAKTGFARRLGCYFSFAGAAAALGPRLLPRPDLLWVESPPLFIGLAARALGARWRCPYVFNVSDLWPESAIRMGVVKPGAATRAAEALELSLYRHSAGVTGQSEEIIASVRARAPGVATEIITNGVDARRFGPDRLDGAARALVGDAPGPVFMYAGLLGLAQGLDQILDVAKALPPELGARFVLVGEGPAREGLERRIASEGLGARVRLVPPVARDRVPALLAAADVAVISLGMSIPGAVPSKIYEAMAAGLPILLIADGEPARRVEQAGAGLWAAPGDLGGVRGHVERLARDAGLRARLGAAGRRAAETTYDRTRIAERLDAFLARAVAGGATHPQRTAA
jgi:glycosyltransferase involved in cell wall biosynthesis